jgi:hypothetical protein
MKTFLADIRSFLLIGDHKKPKEYDSFSISDSEKRFEYFFHHFNCGFPGKRRTERTVELALADFWLEKVSNAWEIGAVTPYYWNGRIKEIIDPSDNHPNVTQRCSLFDVDFSDQNVISISTLEHVGENFYGLNEEATPAKAIKKIVKESNLMLATCPIGWNKQLDDFVFGEEIIDLCKIRFLVRNRDETWSPALKDEANRPYGGRKVDWANSLAILEKGSIL